MKCLCLASISPATGPLLAVIQPLRALIMFLASNTSTNPVDSLDLSGIFKFYIKPNPRIVSLRLLVYQCLILFQKNVYSFIIS
jgi:hypothetical protein